MVAPDDDVGMKALVKAEAKPGLWLQDVPEPKIEADEVLIKVLRTGLCGTDLHIQSWDHWAQKNVPVPMVTGHEFCGEVVEIGVGVRDVAVGDLVSGEGHLVCGRCRNCRAGRRHLCRNTIGVGVNRPGCFAEFMSLPASNVFKLPPVITDDIASILDPLGNATHTALSFNLVGEDVLISGAGPIGTMAVAIARHVGARHVVVTDINPYRLALARELGATLAIDVRSEKLEDAMQSLGMEEGFDVGLEMSGAPAAFRQMLKTMHHGGSIALLGILPADTGIQWDEVIFKGLMVKGVYGREMFETWYKMAAMLQSGLKIGPVITHRLPIAKFQEGFEIMASGHSGKVILDWENAA